MELWNIGAMHDRGYQFSKLALRMPKFCRAPRLSYWTKV